MFFSMVDLYFFPNQQLGKLFRDFRYLAYKIVKNFMIIGGKLELDETCFSSDLEVGILFLIWWRFEYENIITFELSKNLQSHGKQLSP